MIAQQKKNALNGTYLLEIAGYARATFKIFWNTSQMDSTYKHDVFGTIWEKIGITENGQPGRQTAWQSDWPSVRKTIAEIERKIAGGNGNDGSLGLESGSSEATDVSPQAVSHTVDVGPLVQSVGESGQTGQICQSGQSGHSGQIGRSCQINL